MVSRLESKIMRKRNLFDRLELQWFYLSPTTRQVIEFIGGVMLFILIMGIALTLGYVIGKSQIGL